MTLLPLRIITLRFIGLLFSVVLGFRHCADSGLLQNNSLLYQFFTLQLTAEDSLVGAAHRPLMLLSAAV